jgi:hypothetical protein
MIWALLSSINLLMEASALLLGGELGSVMTSWARLPSVVGFAVLLVALAIYATKRFKSGWSNNERNFLDSFTVENIKRASFVSIITTLAVIILSDAMMNESSLPGEFFIKISGFTLTMTLVVSYLIFSKGLFIESQDER